MQDGPHAEREPVREPMLNAPASIVWVIGLLVAIHAGLDLLDENRRAWWKLTLAFIPSRYSERAFPFTDDIDGAALWSFVTHQFIHADWPHVGLNCAWLLAFGGVVAKRIGMLRFATLGLTSGIAGAVLFLLFQWGEPTPMAGASGAVSGLMGAAFRFFFVATDASGVHAARNVSERVPRMSLRATLSDPRIRLFVAIWLFLNFASALAAPYLTDAGGIAWEAHLGGFAFGLFMFGLFDPQNPAGGDERSPWR